MKKSERKAILSGQILDDEINLSLAELCRACDLPAEQVVEMVEYGVVEPVGREPGQWRFQAVSLRRIRSARRLRQDLGVNTAGIALALDLLDEMDAMRARLRRFEDGV